MGLCKISFSTTIPLLTIIIMVTCRAKGHKKRPRGGTRRTGAKPKGCAHLLLGGGVCVELERERGGGREGVGVEVGQPLRDVRRGHPEAEVLDGAAQRGRPRVQVGGAEPLGRGHGGRRRGARVVVGLVVAAACPADHVGRPRQDPRHGDDRSSLRRERAARDLNEQASTDSTSTAEELSLQIATKM